MGFITGQGADAFTKNFLQTYTTLNEQSRLAEEQKQRMQMQQMQMQAMQQEQDRKSNYQQAIQGLMAPQNNIDSEMLQGNLMANPQIVDPITGMPNEAGQSLMGQSMIQTPGQFSAQDYMQKVVPYLSEGEQVKVMQQQMQPREQRAPNEFDMLRGAAAGDPLALRMFEMQQEAKKSGKAAPTGYRYNANGDMEPVPGGPADWQKQQKQQAAYGKVTEINAGLDMISETAEKLRDSKGLEGITGIRGKIPNLPGSEAANSAALLQSLKAQTGLTVLANLKAATGAGLGQVTEAEHKLLQNYLTQLDTAQSPEQFKLALNKISEYAAGAKARLQTGFDGLYGQKASLDSSRVANVDPIIQEASKVHGVPANLIKAVMKNESGFDPGAKASTSSAKGLMQLIDSTAREMGVNNPHDPVESTHGGAKYLAIQLQKFGDVPSAVAAYHDGPAKIETLKRLYPKDWQARLSPVTKAYVGNVLKTMQGYEQAPADGGMISYKRVK